MFCSDHIGTEFLYAQLITSKLVGVSCAKACFHIFEVHRVICMINMFLYLVSCRYRVEVAN